MKRLFSLLILGIISLSSFISIATALPTRDNPTRSVPEYKAALDGARSAFKGVVEAAKNMLDDINQ